MAGPADGALEVAIAAWEQEKKGSKPVPKNRELLPPIPHMINGCHKGSLRGPQTPGKGGFSAPKGGVFGRKPPPKTPLFGRKPPPFRPKTPPKTPLFRAEGGFSGGLSFPGEKVKNPQKGVKWGYGGPQTPLGWVLGGLGH